MKKDPVFKAPELDRPLFQDEKWEDKVVTEIMKLKPKDGDLVVFRNLRTDEIQPLDRAIRDLRQEGKLPSNFEVLLFESQIEVKYVPAVAEATVKIRHIERLGAGSLIIAAGLPLHLQRYMHITLREMGVMPPGSALVTLPEPHATFETMSRADLITLLNHLIAMKGR